MSETALSKSIKTALEKSGYPVLRLQSGRVQLQSGHWMVLCPKGTPDLLVLPMRAFVEVKQPGMVDRNRGHGTKEAQAEFRRYCENNDIPHAVVTSASEALAFVRGVESKA